MEIECRKIRNDEKEKYINYFLKEHQNGRTIVEIYKWMQNRKEFGSIPESYAAWSDSIIVGAVNVIPVDLTLNRVKIKGAWQQDSLVSKKFRGKGVGRQLISAASENKEMIIAKGTTLPMYKLRKSIGYSDVPNSNILIKVLNPFVPQYGLKKVFIYMLLYTYSKLKFYNDKTKLKISEITFFDKTFDIKVKSKRRLVSLV